MATQIVPMPFFPVQDERCHCVVPMPIPALLEAEARFPQNLRDDEIEFRQMCARCGRAV